MVSAAMWMKIIYAHTLLAFLALIAWFVWRARPQAEVNRVVALFFLIFALDRLKVFGGLDPVGYDLALPSENLWKTWWIAFIHLRHIALVGVFYVYPRKPPLRSWHTAVIGTIAALWLGNVLAWFLDPSIFLAGIDLGRAQCCTQTAMWRTLMGAPGVGFLSLLLVASAVVRARGLAPTQRRAALLAIPVFISGTLHAIGITLTRVVELATGTNERLLASARYYMGFDVPLDAILLMWVLAGVGFLAIAAWLLLRHRAPVAAAMVTAGMLYSLLPFTTGINFTDAHLFFAGIVLLFVLVRYAHLGCDDPPIPEAQLPWVVSSILFVGVLTGIWGKDPTTSMFLAGFIVASLFAVVTAWTLHPYSKGFLRRLGQASGGALTTQAGIYRMAVEAEVIDGRSAEAISTKLLPMRTKLGISEMDHARIETLVRANLSEPSTRAAEPEPGELVLGRYRVEQRLGTGGQGTAWLATDEALDRPVVLKRILNSPVHQTEKLLREARAVARVDHPNVITIFDVQQVGDEVVLILEYVPGGSLSERLDRGPLGDNEVATLVDDLTRALGALHAQGIIHRDVKPSNIFLTETGRFKLGDMGVAHVPGFETTAGRFGEWVDPVGTIQYMSPEQARGQSVEQASDLYSAGLTIYEAIIGEPYLDAEPTESPVELQMRVASTTELDAPMGELGALEGWMRTALAVDPTQRFASAQAMRQALSNASEAGSR